MEIDCKYYEMDNEEYDECVKDSNRGRCIVLDGFDCPFNRRGGAP